MTREERIQNLHLSSDDESEFKSVYIQYENDDQKKGEKEKALQWRFEHLIPKSQLLLEKRYSPRQDIKCLFVLVGTTVEPLLLSILTLRPSEKLVLIYSSASEKQKKIIKNTLFQRAGKNLIQKKWLCDENAKKFIEQVKNMVISVDYVLITETTPEKVFAKIKSMVGSFRPNDTGVDITGGKKSMVGGGFLAASINNYYLFYIDFDEYKDSQPVKGTEFVHILPNPYHIYNVQLISQAKELFKRHNYQAAYSIFSEIEKKLSPDGLDKPAKFDLDDERLKVEKMKQVFCLRWKWRKCLVELAS